MNRRLLLILLCAFFAAAAASYIVYRMVGREVNARARGRIHTVMTAKQDLDIGAVIRSEDLKPGDFVGEPPKGTVSKPENAIGRGVVSKVYAGEALMEDRLAAPGSGGGLAATIPQGMRACAVKVNEVVGVAGFAVPGMRVDVLVSGAPTAGFNANLKSRTLLQNIQVLSAGTNFQRDNEGKPVQVQVVNLLVNPEQAELLTLASNELKIQLVLRNPLDTKMTNPPPVEMARMFGDQAPRPQIVPRRERPAPVVEKPAAPPPPRPAVYTVQVLNGNKRSEQSFPVAGERP